MARVEVVVYLFRPLNVWAHVLEPHTCCRNGEKKQRDDEAPNYTVARWNEDLIEPMPHGYVTVTLTVVLACEFGSIERKRFSTSLRTRSARSVMPLSVAAIVREAVAPAAGGSVVLVYVDCVTVMAMAMLMSPA